MKTTILSVDAAQLGVLTAVPTINDALDNLNIQLDTKSEAALNLIKAVEQLRTSDVPVAFPTETVYGLGADATRSAAVKGIYTAKQRPSDNPLIVHFSSLEQLRATLIPRPHPRARQDDAPNYDPAQDPIPDIYKPLISRFWPGPMTIILANPRHSILAPEVTAGLSTFGARIPRHILALALIQLAGVPIAAPSANASTKPSPTAAEHVAFDLEGRVEIILDGGPCDVGVESTVVDGLSKPPLILRPGGISLDQIRSCPGWESTEVGYKNTSEEDTQPKAPGMKYRHYSPRATVVLYEAGRGLPTVRELQQRLGRFAKVGMICTKSWTVAPNGIIFKSRKQGRSSQQDGFAVHNPSATGFAGLLRAVQSKNQTVSVPTSHTLYGDDRHYELVEVDLGPNTADIARGIFSSLRALDRTEVDAIFVEGIDDSEGHTAAAVMNRLRKAAEVKV